MRLHVLQHLPSFCHSLRRPRDKHPPSHMPLHTIPHTPKIATTCRSHVYHTLSTNGGAATKKFSMWHTWRVIGHKSVQMLN